MSTLTGILLDVSGSMRSSIGNGIQEEGGTWIRSIFTVIDDLVKHDVSRNNYVFAIGVGASQIKETFDIIRAIQYFTKGVSTDKGPVRDSTIGSIFEELEKNGEYRVRQWVSNEQIQKVLSENKARQILQMLQSDKKFAKKVVREHIPFVKETRSKWYGATVEDIKKLTTLAQNSINESLLFRVSEQSVSNVRDVINAIRGHVGDEKLTTRRVLELFDIVEPFIFGRTPLYTALEEASKMMIMSMDTYPDHRKLLFILSDGCPTDKGDTYKIQAQLRDANVTVVSCYISGSSNVTPQRLYSNVDQRWEKGAKFLFRLSSRIPTELVTRAIFIKHGWHIGINNNEIRLFLQVNHPNNLKDVCDLARNAVCSQDTLTDLLGAVSLDIYINQKNTGIKAHEQLGETCYANASAAVLHLAMHRILGRDDGYPDFEDIRDNLISRHGSKGANTFHVLKEVCPLYRLHCRQVDAKGAFNAVAAKRPVVANFGLTDDEWDTFGKFYQNNPSGILKKSHLDISKRSADAETGGHAVVLTSYNSECLCLMNSWGERWADMGFFRIQNAEVLGLEFIDVFWTLKDLYQKEQDYYSAHGSEVAAKLMRSLKGLQVHLIHLSFMQKGIERN